MEEVNLKLLNEEDKEEVEQRRGIGCEVMITKAEEYELDEQKDEQNVAIELFILQQEEKANFYQLNYHLRKYILGFLSFKELKRLLYVGKQMNKDILNYFRTNLSKLQVTDTLRFENDGYRVFFKEFGHNLKHISIFCQGLNYMDTINSLPDGKIEGLKLIMCPSFWLKQRSFYRLLKLKFGRSLISLQIQVYMQISNNKGGQSDYIDDDLMKEHSNNSFNSNSAMFLSRKSAINQISQPRMQQFSTKPVTLPFLQAFWSSFRCLNKISMKEVPTFLDLTSDYNLLLQSIFTSPNLELRVLKIQNMLIPSSLVSNINRNNNLFLNTNQNIYPHNQSSNPLSQNLQTSNNNNYNNNSQNSFSYSYQQSNLFQQQSSSFQQQSSQFQQQSSQFQQQSSQFQQQSNQIQNQQQQEQSNNEENNQLYKEQNQLSQECNKDKKQDIQLLQIQNENCIQNKQSERRIQQQDEEEEEEEKQQIKQELSAIQQSQSFRHNPMQEMTISFSQVENLYQNNSHINQNNTLNMINNNTQNMINNNNNFNVNSQNMLGMRMKENSLEREDMLPEVEGDEDMDEQDTIGFNERQINHNQLMLLNNFSKLETFKIVSTRNSSSFMGINDSTLECLLKLMPKTLIRLEILDFQGQSNFALREKSFSEKLFVEFIQYFNNLRKLSINCYKTRQYISNFALLHLAQTFTDLNCLGLASCNSINSGILNQLICQNSASLQELNMDYTQLEGALNLLVQAGAQLKKVSINYCKRITKEEIINFCTYQNNLEELSLKQVKCFTKKALIPLVHNNYKSLKKLILEGNKIDNTHIAYLIRYCRSLQSLALRKMDKVHDNFSNMLFSHIEGFANRENYSPIHEKLTYLDISYNPSFNDECIQGIHSLFPNLYTFTLDSCSINSLNSLLPLSSTLNSLNLSGNLIIIKHENQFEQFCQILQKFTYLNTIFIEIPNIDMLLKHSNFVWNSKPIIIKESFNMCCYPITRTSDII